MCAGSLAAVVVGPGLRREDGVGLFLVIPAQAGTPALGGGVRGGGVCAGLGAAVAMGPGLCRDDGVGGAACAGLGAAVAMGPGLRRDDGGCPAFAGMTVVECRICTTLDLALDSVTLIWHLQVMLRKCVRSSWLGGSAVFLSLSGSILRCSCGVG